MATLLRRLSLNQIVLLLLILVAVGSSGASLINNTEGYTPEWRSGWFQNFSTEVFGAIMTFALFELIVGSRKEREKEREAEARKVEELKARLVREAGSTINSLAVQAINELEARDWLRGENSLLKGANLLRTNLAGAKLWQANLAWANLIEARLEGAELAFANLAGANLTGANLARVDMTCANLAGTNFGATNLGDAMLEEANLDGANLIKANLKGADLHEVNFNEKTILPDANYMCEDDNDNAIYDKHWTPDTDMTRYTDPNHPDFWQPEWVKKQNKEE